MAFQVEIPIQLDAQNGALSTDAVAPAPVRPETPHPATPPQLKPLPQPRHAVIDENRFSYELHKMDLESELALAEQGLAEYLEQCPPY